MLQILTYLLAIYLVVKGVEVLQVGLASSRSDRTPLIIIGGLTLVACVIFAITLVGWQDQQAEHISRIGQ